MALGRQDGVRRTTVRPEIFRDALNKPGVHEHEPG